MPHSRPMSVIGTQCHELRVVDGDRTWRVVYHVAADAIVILDVFAKKSQATPHERLELCRRRLALYKRAVDEKERA